MTLTTNSRYRVTLIKPLLVWALLPAAVNAQDYDLLFTGEVFSQQAQEIFVPLTTNWQARISMMLPEGTRVLPGQVAVEFDGSEVARQLEQQVETRRTEEAKTRRDIAKLEQELVAARFKLELARITLELATLKADVPQGLVGGLEFAENKLTKEKAGKAVEDAVEQLADKQHRAKERKRMAELDEKKAINQHELWNQMLASFTVEATRPGFLIYGKHPWTRAKFQDGDTVQTSFRVAQIADTSDLAVRVWINSVDRPRIKIGAPVSIMFDALPKIKADGHVESISDSGAQRKEWGGALYYEGVVSFERPQHAELLPGMSVLVEPK